MPHAQAASIRQQFADLAEGAAGAVRRTAGYEFADGEHFGPQKSTFNRYRPLSWVTATRQV
ncbi:hypothetical protein [Streptomyces fagopyri]|uniref:hypothetical protein n=1 Tax=Streptomyces fagopyri TaxID=2662397 RepID=UPI0033EF402A